MADRGLQEAIRAVGGVTELARRIGISQPSVSNWTRIPAERVLEVESATGMARAVLRPDLYDEMHERPLARLRQDLARFGVARSDGVAEPEDHAGILCEIMAGLTSGELPAPEGSSRAIFEKHMAPWIARFFADLEGAEAAEFYRRVGTVGRVFIEIETEAFTLPA
jgi:DNA-binding transcriptional regulator YdaS (Cro superfamily)